MAETFAEKVGALHAAAPEMLARLMAGPGDTAELFAEHTYRERLTMRYDRWRAYGDPWEEYATDLIEGTGLHVLSNGSSRYGSVQGFEPTVVRIKADELRGEASADIVLSRSKPRGSLALPPDRIERVSLEEKRSLLRSALDAALSLEPRLRDLEVTFQGTTRETYVVSSEDRPTFCASSLVGLRVESKEERRDRRIGVYAIGGGTGGVGQFLMTTPESVAEACVERLQSVLKARPLAQDLGTVPVVIEGGWGGVWLHESVGHLLEAGTAGPYGPQRLGERVASEDVTIIDDGTFTSGRGTALFDDEGCVTERTVLVERGILRNLMTDRRQAAELGIPRTGNGRRQDYRREPLARMTNLFLENGSATPEDLIAQVGRGVYARTITNGGLYPSDDAFFFTVMEGYMIEDGRLTTPLTSIRLSGRPSEALAGIVGIADDFRVDPARGICQKDGQTVPVSVGMPTVLVSNLSVSELR